MIPFLIDLSSYLCINILIYEYPEINDNANLEEKEEEMLETTESITTYVYSFQKYQSIILMGYSRGFYLIDCVKDDQIGYMITMKICSRLNFIYEWYPKKGDHYNIVLKNTYRRKLLQRIKNFYLWIMI